MVLVGLGKKESLSENPVLKKTAKSNPCYYFDDDQDAFAYVKRRPVHLIVIDGLEGLTPKIPFVRKLRRRGFYTPVAILIENPKADLRRTLRKFSVDLITPDQLQEIVDVAIETSKSKAVKGTKYEATEIKRKGVDRSEIEGKKVSLRKDRDQDDTHEIESSGLERQPQAMINRSGKQESRDSTALGGDKPEEPRDKRAMESDEEPKTENAEGQNDSDESKEILEALEEEATEESDAGFDDANTESGGNTREHNDSQGRTHTQEEPFEQNKELRDSLSGSDKNSTTEPLRKKAEEEIPSTGKELNDKITRNRDTVADPNHPVEPRKQAFVPNQNSQQKPQAPEVEIRKERLTATTGKTDEKTAGTKNVAVAENRPLPKGQAGSPSMAVVTGRANPQTESGTLDEKETRVRMDSHSSPGERNMIRSAGPGSGGKSSELTRDGKDTAGGKAGNFPKNSPVEFTGVLGKNETAQKVDRPTPAIAKNGPLDLDRGAAAQKTSDNASRNDLRRLAEDGHEVEKQGLPSTQTQKAEKDGIERSAAAAIRKSGIEDQPSPAPAKNAGLDRQQGDIQKPDTDAKAPPAQAEIHKAGVVKDPRFTATSNPQEMQKPQPASASHPSPIPMAQKPKEPVVSQSEIREIFQNQAPTQALSYPFQQDGRTKDRDRFEGCYFMDFKGFPSLVMMQFVGYAKIVLTRDIAYSHRKHLKAILQRGLSNDRRLLGLTFVGDSALDKRILLHLARLSLKLSDSGITVCLYNCGVEIRDFLMKEQVHYILRAFASEKEFETFAKAK